MNRMKIPNPTFAVELTPQESAKDSAGKRSVAITIYSGATVPRFSWSQGEYRLTLSTDPAHVRLDRISSGRAPILNTHSDWRLSDVLGYMEAGEIREGRLLGTGTIFSGVPDADEAWHKIQQGGLRNVSVGAVIYRMKDLTPEDAKIKEFLAVDWEPYEVSLVPIGADPNAAINLGADRMCEVEVERAIALKGETMPPGTEQPGDAARTDNNTDAIRAAATTAERERAKQIRAIAAPFKLAETFVTGLVDGGITVEAARLSILEELAKRNGPDISGAHGGEIHLAVDERDKRRDAGVQATLFLMNPASAKIDGQNPFRGMSLSRMGEELLACAGVSVRGKTKAEIAELSMLGTADFPYILADSARKQMLAAYQVATPTYRRWTKASTTPDFKTMSRLRLGEAPTLLQVAEGAQITIGSMTESREQYAIATYGRGVSFTLQMFINDDLGAFNDLVTAFGQQAARLENKTVYAILTANGAMADSVALFHANHSNLGTGAIGNTALDAMFTAMGTQKGLDGLTVLNLIPKYLIVPLAKAATATAALTAVGPNVKASDQNWFAGRLEAIADGELDGSSTVVWYGAADPAIAPGIEYAFLEGASGPQILRKDNENGILGVQLYAFEHFGAKAVDWRPLYKSSGS